MALTIPSLGYTQSLGIQYTAVADTAVDFSSASNDTYIYNLADKLVYYKDAQGEIESIFVSTSSFALTTSNSFNGNQTITGSLTTSGSVVDFTNATAISGSTFSGSFVGDGSGLTNIGTSATSSYILGSNVDGAVANATSASYSSNGLQQVLNNGNTATSNLTLTGDLTVIGTGSFDVLITTYQSSSIIYSSGSTKFGDTLDDTHQFTGSLLITGSGVTLVNGIFTGNGSGLTNLTSTNLDNNSVSYGGVTLNLGQTDATPAFNLTDATNYSFTNLTNIPTLVSGSSQISYTGITNVPSGIVSSSNQFTNLTAPFTGSFTGSFEGDGSGLTGIVNAQTASYVTLAQTASYVETAQTASYVENAQTASYVTTAQTASYVLQAISASYATTAQSALSGNGVFSGSFSGSFVGNGSGLTGVVSSSYALSASYAPVDGNGIYDGNGTIPNGTISTVQGTYSIYSGSLSRLLFQPTQTIFNDNQADLDFRVKGDGDASLIRTDAASDAVSMGTTPNASTKLFVVGSTTQHNIGIRSTSGGTTSGTGILALANNVSGSAEGGSFRSTQPTTHANSIHGGARVLADYGKLYTFGLQGVIGAASGFNYSGNAHAISAYVNPTDNYSNIANSYAIHARNQRSNGSTKYGVYVDTIGTQTTSSATIYTGYFYQNAIAASGSTYGTYIENNSLSQTNYGIYITTQNSTSGNNYAIYSHRGSVILNGINNSDSDFQVKGGSDSNLLYVDASTNSIGVGTSTPSYKLDTVGDINTSTGYRVAGAAGLTGTYTFGGGTTGDIATMTFTGGILTAVTTVP